MNITQTILQFRIKWCSELNCTPQQINTGNCDGFAQAITDVVIGAKYVWDDDKGHCFIAYNGRYYDSECPQGCLYSPDLPYYQRLKEIKTF